MSYQAPYLSADEAERVARQPDALKEDNPPILRFYEATIEDRISSARQGRVVYLPIIMVEVSAPGDTKTKVPHVVKGWRTIETKIPVEKEKTVFRDVKQPDGTYLREEKIITEIEQDSFFENEPTEPWFDKLDERLHHGQISQNYVSHCKRAFQMWEERRETPLDGTPVKDWNQATYAQQKNLIEIGLTTIERVAEMTADAETAFGMGARDIKAKAKAYLAANDQSMAAVTLKSMQDKLERIEQERDAERQARVEERTEFEEKMASLAQMQQESDNKPKRRGRPPKNESIDDSTGRDG